MDNVHVLQHGKESGDEVHHKRCRCKHWRCTHYSHWEESCSHIEVHSTQIWMHFVHILVASVQIDVHSVHNGLSSTQNVCFTFVYNLTKNAFNLWPGCYNLRQPGRGTARKWRENEEMKRKWREISSISASSPSFHFLFFLSFPFNSSNFFSI